ncbi:Eco57I restriction-modification methylase domain-containing protein [Natranaeroarchaeum sulfidigenes]|uniref:site-specific DNA-methyltransferase (adenine-specific) n=1 Tax=Natranaeroarchaeum sulfidigenes TaxID=2784880 RepID=A0A897MQT4_9EURY|nr:DNA methyltransferase [Natranaeroarchaeum sulfidigenes]QSG02897.1 Type II restriction enzyme, methylase subunit [Natranaeroarchaeum sulfidigenes]
MTDEQTEEIRQRLDEDLSLDEFERDYRSTGEAATQFFQDLFVQVLNFEETTSPLGDATWQDIPVHEWPDTAPANAARLFAESGNFRVIYVELEKLTRTAERNAIQSLTRSDRTSGWAIEGSFLTVFHAPDEDIWHLVTPYEEGTDDITTGRPVLRRYTLGEGETHRTVADGLSSMDASKGRLAERIDEAFRVKPVTEDFYENYKSAFDMLSKELRRKGLEIEDADRYAHTTLNRLMFFYYLQKKGWIGDRKDFVRWFHQQYEESDEEGVFHEKWLSALFFEGMNSLEGGEIDADLPSDVESAIAGLPYMNGGLFQPTEEDRYDTFLSDSALKSVIKEFLEQYNFTVTEESPYDIDVAVDPAMLGKIYESLIAEQERGEAGIFYTPRVEVDLMCRMALYEQFCDHANDLDAEGKQQIVEFIFSEPQDWDADGSGKTEQLESILHELRIVDPACGSGAFLVGMKQVVTELYRKLGTTPDYHLKEQIINENLYGVDIKDWAVRVAEFRLWLSLVEGEEQLPDQRPVLPNFSFKLKVGDSLIQKLDGEFVSLDTVTRTLDGDTGGLLTELKELKREHFAGEADRTQEIEEKQVELLKNHINGLIDNLSKNGSQQTLFGDTKDEQADDDVEERIEELKETRDAIDSAGATGFFMWDIDFSDVMVEGGFDIVIGNPPYVRQEDIIDQGIHPERLDEMDSGEVRNLKKQYKNDLVEFVEGTFDIKPYKRSDIYVYFYFKGIDLLRENGTLSFITSNSWMDIGYGKRLHEGLLKLTDLSYILGNTSEKSFEDADVNTYITIANRKQQEILANYTRFVSFSRPFFDYDFAGEYSEFLVNPESGAERIGMDDETVQVSTSDGIRTVSLGHDSLWRLGGGSTKQIDDSDSEKVFSEEVGLVNNQAGISSYSGRSAALPTGSYDGGTWGRFIDSPTLYFSLWRDHGDRFTLLGDISEPEYGLKSGANKFFFVPRPGTENSRHQSEMDCSTGELLLHHKETGRDFRIEPEFWMQPIEEIPSRYHSQYNHKYTDDDGRTLVPDLILVKNREIKTSPIEPEHLNNVHIDIELSRPELESKNANVLEYIEFGEESRWGRSSDGKLSNRSSLRNRNPEWYSQPSVRDPYVLLTRTFNAEFQFHYNPCGFQVADNFYFISTLGDFNPGYIAGYLNSTIGWFLEEVTGRSWTNTLRFDKPEYLILPIIKTNDEVQAQVESRLESLMERDMGHVFEELGAYNPDDVSLESVKSDRKALDSEFFDDLGIDEEQRLSLYKEVVRSARDRLMRQPDENPSLCETIAEHNPQYDYSR